MLVFCELIERSMRHVDGKEYPGGVIRCLRCNHAVENHAKSPNGIVIGAAIKLRKSCPRGESNFYRPDEDTRKTTKDWHRERKAERRAAGKKGGRP